MKKCLGFKYGAFFVVLFCISSLCAIAPLTSHAQGFTVEGEIRGRYENLDGQFRAGEEGSDEVLLFRTLLHGKYRYENITIGVEIQDSRSYWGDDSTPLSSSFVNTADVLQAYVAFSGLPSLLSYVQPQTHSRHTLTVGRQTVSFGSKRQIERVSYANVIKSYTGIYSQTTTDSSNELHAFYVVPIERLVDDKDEVLSNHWQADKEQWGRRIWGIHYRHADTLPSLVSNLWTEAFVYGFDEQDRHHTPTPNRHYLTSGFRIFRKHKPQQWNLDIEAAHRQGSRHSSSDVIDNEDLAVSANMLLFRVGYTFNHWLNPNLAFQHYYTSGDDNPNDNRYGQFERLFGGRRTDLNNTSIHGPLTPANLTATGFRVEFRPNANWDGRVHYSAATLSSNTDSFVIGKYQDSSGQSGDDIGHTVDSRIRFWTDDKTWMFDAGFSLLFAGNYLESLRAQEGLPTSTTRFGYVQLSYQF